MMKRMTSRMMRRCRARAVAALAEQRVAIAMVSCGHQHTAVVTDQGQLWTRGIGQARQLGPGDHQQRCVPVRVTTWAAGWGEGGQPRPL